MVGSPPGLHSEKAEADVPTSRDPMGSWNKIPFEYSQGFLMFYSPPLRLSQGLGWVMRKVTDGVEDEGVRLLGPKKSCLACKTRWKSFFLDPASPSEAGQTVNPDLTGQEGTDRNNVGYGWIFCHNEAETDERAT
jgi:hypothetical protein